MKITSTLDKKFNYVSADKIKDYIRPSHLKNKYINKCVILNYIICVSRRKLYFSQKDTFSSEMCFTKSYYDD